MTADGPPDDDLTREELASLLAFYQDAGLNFPLSEEAPDRFLNEVSELQPASNATGQTPPEPAQKERAQKTTPTVVSVPDAEALELARKAASSAATLEELEATLLAFDACGLKRTARHTIFQAGNKEVDLMVICAAPSKEDDEAGRGLSGPEGALLTQMLAAISLDAQKDVYHGYCAPWFPPGGAKPTERHLKICRPFIDRQIALAAPKYLLLFGNTAMQTMLSTSEIVMHKRGQWENLEIEGRSFPAMATHHPSFLLKEPNHKRSSWLDLLALRAKMSDAN